MLEDGLDEVDQNPLHLPTAIPSVPPTPMAVPLPAVPLSRQSHRLTARRSRAIAAAAAEEVRAQSELDDCISVAGSDV